MHFRSELRVAGRQPRAVSGPIRGIREAVPGSPVDHGFMCVFLTSLMAAILLKCHRCSSRRRRRSSSRRRRASRRRHSRCSHDRHSRRQDRCTFTCNLLGWVCNYVQLRVNWGAKKRHKPFQPRSDGPQYSLAWELLCGQLSGSYSPSVSLAVCDRIVPLVDKRHGGSSCVMG